MRLILVLAAAAAGYFYFRGKDARARRVGVREDLSRWEGEGGSPAGAAAQLPHDPAPFPPVDPAVRH